MDGERCLIFPLSLLLFHGGLSSSCLHTGLYRSFFLCFLFFMTCLVTCQGKSRVAVTVAITTNSSSLCTLESRGSFQGLFASDIPCTTQVRMCENSLDPKVGAARPENACPVGNPVWFTEPRVCLSGCSSASSWGASQEIILSSPRPSYFHP